MVGHIQYDFDHHESPLAQLVGASNWYLGVEPMTFQVLVGWLVGHIQYNFDQHEFAIAQLVGASNWYMGVKPMTFLVLVGWLVIYSMTLITTCLP